MSYASLGNGHASHVAIESFARAANLKMLHVPFKDVGAMLSAVASGEVDFTDIGVNTVAGLVASGRLRALAVAAKKRLFKPEVISTEDRSLMPISTSCKRGSPFFRTNTAY